MFEISGDLLVKAEDFHIMELEQKKRKASLSPIPDSKKKMRENSSPMSLSLPLFKLYNKDNILLDEDLPSNPEGFTQLSQQV